MLTARDRVLKYAVARAAPEEAYRQESNISLGVFFLGILMSQVLSGCWFHSLFPFANMTYMSWKGQAVSPNVWYTVNAVWWNYFNQPNHDHKGREHKRPRAQMFSMHILTTLTPLLRLPLGLGSCGGATTLFLKLHLSLLINSHPNWASFGKRWWSAFSSRTKK